MATSENWRELQKKSLAAATVTPATLVALGALATPVTSVGWGLFLTGSLLAGGGAAAVYGHLLQFFCPGCKKHIARTMPWICGFCDEANSGKFGAQFFGRCKHCTKRPGLLICPHPHVDSENSLFVYEIFLDGGDPAHPARKMTAAQPGETLDETKARWIRERQDIEARILIQHAESTQKLAAATVSGSRADRALTTARSLTGTASPHTAAAQQKERTERLVSQVMQNVSERGAFNDAVEAGIATIKARPDFQKKKKADQRDEIIDFQERCEFQWKKSLKDSLDTSL